MKLPNLSYLKTVGELSRRVRPDIVPMFNEDCLLKLVAQSQEG